MRLARTRQPSPAEPGNDKDGHREKELLRRNPDHRFAHALIVSFSSDSVKAVKAVKVPGGKEKE